MASAALVAALAGWLPTAATATAYRAFACQTPAGTPIPLGAEWKLNHSTTFAGYSDGCAKGGPINLKQGLPWSYGALGHGTGAWAQLTVPTGVRLTGLVGTRTIRTQLDPRDSGASPEWRLELGTGSQPQVADYCPAFDRCNRGNTADGSSVANDAQWPVPYAYSTVTFRVECAGKPAGTCMYEGVTRVDFNLHRVELLLDDSAAPTKSGPAVGTALDPGALKGTVWAQVQLTEMGSGLKEVVAEVDGRQVARLHDPNGGRCADAGFRDDPDFVAIQPCKVGTYDHRLSFDTSAFEDGSHELLIYATDAVGNRSSLERKMITFDNFLPPKNVERPKVAVPTGGLRPGDRLTTTPGTWDGRGVTLAYRWERSEDGASWGEIPKATSTAYVVTRDDIGQYLRAVVIATNKEGAPVEAASERTDKVQTGATIAPAGLAEGSEPAPQPTTAAPGPDDSSAQLVVDREQRTVDVKHGAKIVLTGRLVDAEGQPIANAVVDVFEQLVLTAAPWNKIDSVVTDSQGAYSYRPKTTASRRLRFAYADKRDAAKYRATREVLVSVQGAMTISAKRKVLRPGQMIRLKGRLTVDQLPKTGTWVEVQVLDGGVWRTIATRKTSSKGLWTFKHRLRQSSGITFRFRSRLRPVGDVASAETKSSTLKVRVR